MNGGGEPYRRGVVPGVCLGAGVLAQVAAMATITAVVSYRYYGPTYVIVPFSVSLGAIAIYLIAAGILVIRHGRDAARPVRAARYWARALAAAWLLLPVVLLATAPVSASGFDFGDCGRPFARGRNSLRDDPYGFGADCDRAYATRYLLLAVSVVVALALIGGYAWWTHRRARSRRDRATVTPARHTAPS